MSNFQAWYNVSIFASLCSSEYQGYSLEKHAHLPFRKRITRFQNRKGDSIRKKSWVCLSKTALVRNSQPIREIYEKDQKFPKHQLQFQISQCSKYNQLEFQPKSMRKGSNCWNSLVPGSLFPAVPNAQDPMHSA